MINRGVAVLRSRLHGHGDHQDEAQETAQVAEERTHHVAALAMEMVYIIYMLYHVNVYIMYIIYNVIIYIYMSDCENPRFTERTSTNLGRSHRLPHVCTIMIYGKLGGYRLQETAAFIYIYVMNYE